MLNTRRKVHMSWLETKVFLNFEFLILQLYERKTMGKA